MSFCYFPSFSVTANTWDANMVPEGNSLEPCIFCFLNFLRNYYFRPEKKKTTLNIHSFGLKWQFCKNVKKNKKVRIKKRSINL